VDPLDRELASLLSVDPSPEFRARVRARIAGEPLPRPWYLQWRAAAAGAAAAAFVAGVAIVGVAPIRTPPPAVPFVANVRAPSVPAVDAPSQPSRVAALVANRRPRRANGPEALMDVSAHRGIRQLDALVREGRTQLVFDDEPEPGRAIVVAPIVVDPIAVTTLSEPAGDAEGDGQ